MNDCNRKAERVTRARTALLIGDGLDTMAFKWAAPPPRISRSLPSEGSIIWLEQANSR